MDLFLVCMMEGGKGGGKWFLSLPTPLCSVLQCHTQIHCAISKVDVEKDIQALMEETAILSTENKSEFLLTDYFVSTERQEVTFTGHLSHVLRSHVKTVLKEMSSSSPPNLVSCSPKLTFELLITLLHPPKDWDYKHVSSCLDETLFFFL